MKRNLWLNMIMLLWTVYYSCSPQEYVDGCVYDIEKKPESNDGTEKNPDIEIIKHHK